MSSALPISGVTSFLGFAPGVTPLWEKDTNDMAAVRVRILDENGTPAPYAQFPVQFAVEGSAALVGPQTAVAEGGMTGTYLRTVGTAGEALLTVSAPQTQPVMLHYKMSTTPTKLAESPSTS